MSRDWTPGELLKASEVMKAAGHLSYEEFCEKMDNGHFATVTVPDKHEEQFPKPGS